MKKILLFLLISLHVGLFSMEPARKKYWVIPRTSERYAEFENCNQENKEYLLKQAERGYENCEGFAKFALLTFGLGTIVLAPKWDNGDTMDQASQSDWCCTNTLRKMFGTGCLLLGSWAGAKAWKEHKRYKKYVFELKKS